MSVTFCHVLHHKCTRYLLATPQTSNLLVRRVHKFHVYFHIRLILHDLGISLPHEDGFSKVKNAYIESAYYTVCDDYGVDADEA